MKALFSECVLWVAEYHANIVTCLASLIINYKAFIGNHRVAQNGKNKHFETNDRQISGSSFVLQLSATFSYLFKYLIQSTKV